MLEEIFRFTAAVRWPARGHEHWDDFALFYLGGIVTVQALVDGNKRVGKMAYALTLIKGGRPFRAPVPKLENELYRMNETPRGIVCQGASSGSGPQRLLPRPFHLPTASVSG